MNLIKLFKASNTIDPILRIYVHVDELTEIVVTENRMYINNGMGYEPYGDENDLQYFYASLFDYSKPKTWRELDETEKNIISPTLDELREMIANSN